MKKRRGLLLLCCLFLLCGCGGKAEENLAWREEPFSARIEGESFCGHFSATVTVKPDGEKEIVYHSPEVLAKVRAEQNGEEVFLSKEEVGCTLSEDSVQKLLLPLRMMTGRGSVQKLRHTAGGRFFTLLLEEDGVTVEVSETKDGIPTFLSSGSCRFSVLEFVFENA